MGKKDDIAWIMKVIEENRKIRVLQKTDAMSLRKSKRFYRSYIQIEKNTLEREEEEKCAE